MGDYVVFGHSWARGLEHDYPQAKNLFGNQKLEWKDQPGSRIKWAADKAKAADLGAYDGVILFSFVNDWANPIKKIMEDTLEFCANAYSSGAQKIIVFNSPSHRCFKNNLAAREAENTYNAWLESGGLARALEKKLGKPLDAQMVQVININADIKLDEKNAPNERKYHWDSAGLHLTDYTPALELLAKKINETRTELVLEKPKAKASAQG